MNHLGSWQQIELNADGSSVQPFLTEVGQG